MGKIAYHPDFVCTELGVHKAKLQLQDELASYCVMVEPPKTTFGKVRKTYTGKVHGACRCDWLSFNQPLLPTLAHVHTHTHTPMRRRPLQANRTTWSLHCNWPRLAAKSSSRTRGTRVSATRTSRARKRAGCVPTRRRAPVTTGRLPTRVRRAGSFAKARRRRRRRAQSASTWSWRPASRGRPSSDARPPTPSGQWTAERVGRR